MAPYRCAISGASYGQNQSVVIETGGQVRLPLMNMTQ